jgi:predicted transcriptional regulator
MAADRANDLQAFRTFIDEKVSNGGSNLTLEEALVHWEIENQSEEEREETLEAIRRGFADIEAGRVRPAREALEELRKKHNLPPLSSATQSS